MDLTSRKWWVLLCRKDTNINQGWALSSPKISRPQPISLMPKLITSMGATIWWRIRKVLSIDSNWPMPTWTLSRACVIIASRTQADKILNISTLQAVFTRIQRQLKITERLRACPVQVQNKLKSSRSSQVRHSNPMVSSQKMDRSQSDLN